MQGLRAPSKLILFIYFHMTIFIIWRVQQVKLPEVPSIKQLRLLSSFPLKVSQHFLNTSKKEKKKELFFSQNLEAWVTMESMRMSMKRQRGHCRSAVKWKPRYSPLLFNQLPQNLPKIERNQERIAVPFHQSHHKAATHLKASTASIFILLSLSWMQRSDYGIDRGRCTYIPLELEMFYFNWVADYEMRRSFCKYTREICKLSLFWFLVCTFFLDLYSSS